MMNDGNRQPAETPAWQQKRGRQAYVAAALAAAKSRRLTPAMVRGLTYEQVAQMCGVQIGPNGESPSDFLWVNQRRRIAEEIENEQESIEDAKVRTDVNATLAKYGKVIEDYGYGLRFKDVR